MLKKLCKRAVRVSLALAFLLVVPQRFGAQDRITCTYDQQGRLTGLSVREATAVTYEYDQDGRLVSVTQYEPVSGAAR